MIVTLHLSIHFRHKNGLRRRRLVLLHPLVQVVLRGSLLWGGRSSCTASSAHVLLCLWLLLMLLLRSLPIAVLLRRRALPNLDVVVL